MTSCSETDGFDSWEVHEKRKKKKLERAYSIVGLKGSNNSIVRLDESTDHVFIFYELFKRIVRGVIRNQANIIPERIERFAFVTSSP